MTVELREDVVVAVAAVCVGYLGGGFLHVGYCGGVFALRDEYVGVGGLELGVESGRGYAVHVVAFEGGYGVVV